MKNLTKDQESKIVANERLLQAVIDAGGNERPWDGELPESKDGRFPARKTSNINVIVEDSTLFEKTLANIGALDSTGRYITCDFYGMSLIATCGYEGKVSGANEIQFTEMSVSKTNAHGTEDAIEQFNKVFGAGRDVKVHTLKGETTTPTPVKVEDPFA